MSPAHGWGVFPLATGPSNGRVFARPPLPSLHGSAGMSWLQRGLQPCVAHAWVLAGGMCVWLLQRQGKPCFPSRGGKEEQKKKKDIICFIRVLPKLFWEINLTSISPSLKGSPTAPEERAVVADNPATSAFSLHHVPTHLKAEMQDVLGPKGEARSPVLPPPPPLGPCAVRPISETHVLTGRSPSCHAGSWGN